MSENTAWDELSVEDGKYGRVWSFSCQNTKLLDQFYSYDDWHTNRVFDSCKDALGGYNRITAASDEFLSRLGYEFDGKLYKVTEPNDKKIAAFCHHGFGTAWLSHLLPIPPHIFWASFDIAHSSVTILEFKNNPDGITAPTCVCLSDVSHIYKEKLPLRAAISFFGD